MIGHCTAGGNVVSGKKPECSLGLTGILFVRSVGFVVHIFDGLVCH